jgi:hypothetical protein
VHACAHFTEPRAEARVDVDAGGGSRSGSRSSSSRLTPSMDGCARRARHVIGSRLALGAQLCAAIREGCCGGDSCPNIITPRSMALRMFNDSFLQRNVHFVRGRDHGRRWCGVVRVSRTASRAGQCGLAAITRITVYPPPGAGSPPPAPWNRGCEMGLGIRWNGRGGFIMKDRTVPVASSLLHDTI